MLCTIDGETFYSCTKNAWIGNAGALCHQWWHQSYDITSINESVQRSLGNMLTKKKGKLCLKAWQFNCSKRLHVLWPMKICTKAYTNLYALTFKLSWGNKIKSKHKNYNVIHFSDGDIILDCGIKAHDSWVAGVKFLWETSHKRAQLSKFSTKRDITNIHAELSYPSEVLIHATGRKMGIHLTGTFEPHEDCAIGKAKRMH